MQPTTLLGYNQSLHCLISHVLLLLLTLGDQKWYPLYHISMKEYCDKLQHSSSKYIEI